MSFKGLDLDEEMFAEMAASAENTGEKDPSSYSKKKVVKIEEDGLLMKKPKIEVPKVEVPKAEVKTAEPVNQWTKEAEKSAEKKEPKAVQALEQPREPVVQVKPPVRKVFNADQGITVDAVAKILEMNRIFNTYLDDEKNFVTMYFQVDKVGDADVIYKALTSNPRELEALKMIVNAKEQTAAERAFYLMSLSNQAIEDIFGQLSLLTEGLGDKGVVTNENKLNVCRRLEKVISETTDDMFAYIYKLKEFAEQALSN